MREYRKSNVEEDITKISQEIILELHKRIINVSNTIGTPL